jgi:hypothetical protein
MTRFRRIAAVTVGLVAAGASAGALAAVAGLAVMLGWVAVFSRDPAALLWGAAYAYLGAVGAALGAVAGPAVGWGLLRRVPLGAAVVSVAGGALVGAYAGMLAQAAVPGLPGAWLWGGPAGAVAAAAGLRRRHRPGAGAGAAQSPNVALQATRSAGLAATLPPGSSPAGSSPPAEPRA